MEKKGYLFRCNAELDKDENSSQFLFKRDSFNLLPNLNTLWIPLIYIGKKAGLNLGSEVYAVDLQGRLICRDSLNEKYIVYLVPEKWTDEHTQFLAGCLSVKLNSTIGNSLKLLSGRNIVEIEQLICGREEFENLHN